MYYIVETAKSFEQASKDLEAAVAGNGYGVLHIHDLGATLRTKGVAFEEQCRILKSAIRSRQRKSLQQTCA
jgi:uncharacterized protein (DUF302 family)